MASAYRRRVLRMLFTGALLLALVALLPAAVRTARTAGPSPRELERACDEGNAFLVTTSFRGVAHEQSNEAFVLEAPSVVLFSDTPNNRPQYVLATLKQVGTVWGLAYRSADKSIYAAAYHKVQLPFGPGGPGAVYRIDLGSGDVGLALTVPEAGPDTHERRINWQAQRRAGGGLRCGTADSPGRGASAHRRPWRRRGREGLAGHGRRPAALLLRA